MNELTDVLDPHTVVAILCIAVAAVIVLLVWADGAAPRPKR